VVISPWILKFQHIKGRYGNIELLKNTLTSLSRSRKIGATNTTRWQEKSICNKSGKVGEFENNVELES
jgi:hypothetical protein